MVYLHLAGLIQFVLGIWFELWSKWQLQLPDANTPNILHFSLTRLILYLNENDIAMTIYHHVSIPRNQLYATLHQEQVQRRQTYISKNGLALAC